MSQAQAENDRRIDYVELTESDIGAAKRFYGEVFGWEFTDYGPDYCEFRDGRLTGGFTKGNASGSGGPLVIIYAVDLEGVQDAVRAAGGEVVEPIFAFPGGRRFHFRDPGGNVLGVWSDA